MKMEAVYTPDETAAGNNNIIFLNEAGIMINASQMAKPFGKRPADWLRMSSAKNFLQELGNILNVPVTALIKKVKRNAATGTEAITWMQEDAAMEFARWLSPSFVIWSNQQTKALLLHGQAGAAQQAPVTAPLSVLSPLVSKLELFEESAYEQARKLQYHDAVLQSRTLITTTMIAKELGISAIALNKMLHEKKVIYRSNNHWVLYADYCGKSYTGTKTAIFRDSSGNYQSNIHTYWTEKGREFIHALWKAEEQAA